MSQIIFKITKFKTFDILKMKELLFNFEVKETRITYDLFLTNLKNNDFTFFIYKIGRWKQIQM